MMDSGSDIEARPLQRAAMAWDAMPGDVAFALRRKVAALNAIAAIREVGRHHHDGQCSITPFPTASGFGAQGLVGNTYIFERLCERDR